MFLNLNIFFLFAEALIQVADADLCPTPKVEFVDLKKVNKKNKKKLLFLILNNLFFENYFISTPEYGITTHKAAISSRTLEKTRNSVGVNPTKEGIQRSL